MYKKMRYNCKTKSKTEAAIEAKNKMIIIQHTKRTTNPKKLYTHTKATRRRKEKRTNLNDFEAALVPQHRITHANTRMLGYTHKGHITWYKNINFLLLLIFCFCFFLRFGKWKC